MFPWRRLGIRRDLQVMERVLEPGNPAEPTSRMEGTCGNTGILFCLGKADNGK